MRGISNKTYVAGVLMVLVGGAGLAEISTSNHGCFVLCVSLFAVGFAICLTEYIK